MSKTILILAANPKDTSPLRLDQEVREIDNGFQRAKDRDDYVIKQKWATRPEDIRRAMLDFKPNIVHFCGHGAGVEGIAFEDVTGHTQLVKAEVLSGFFELFSNRLECVVLNACLSEVQAEAIAKHIPYVIGIKGAIGDTGAINFAIAFYDALGAGESIEFAYKLACNAIEWTGTHEGVIPVLKMAFSKPVLSQETHQKSEQMPVKLLFYIPSNNGTYEIREFRDVTINMTAPASKVLEAIIEAFPEVGFRPDQVDMLLVPTDGRLSNVTIKENSSIIIMPKVFDKAQLYRRA